MKLIDIIMTNGQSRKVEAIQVNGLLALHHALIQGVKNRYASYTITHIPTRRSIVNMYLRDEAIEFLSALSNSFDWNFGCDDVPSLSKKDLEILKEESKFEFETIGADNC